MPSPHSYLAALKGSSLIRSVICIVCTGLIASVSVWLLNRTSEKPVTINAACKTLSLPVALSIKLHGLKSVHLTGYKGYLGMIDELKINANQLSQVFNDKKQITFSEKSAGEAGALSPPSFQIEPQPSYGEMTIQVNESATLRIPDGTETEKSSLEVESGRAEDTKLKLQMDAVELDAYRVVVQELKGIKVLEGEDSLNIFAANKTAMMRAEFVSGLASDRGARVVASLVFDEPKEVPLVSSDTKPVEFDGQLALSACLAPDIKIAGEDPPKEIKTNPLDLKLQAKGMVLTEIMIAPPQRSGELHTLRIKGKGMVKSVKQDNRELISTMLEEILNKPAAEKSLYGLGALLCIFAGGVFLKRALDVLAAILIPAEKSTKGG